MLAALAEHVGATHAALLTGGPAPRRLAAAGPRRSEPLEAVRSRHELRLASLPRLDDVDAFDAAGLRAAGIDSLLGRAVRVAVRGPVGATAVLSREDEAPFAPHRAEIAAWAGGFLAELLPRVSKSAAVRREARRDGLTGLANRRAFEDRLEELFAEARGGGELALLMCDLDRFKRINDELGHQTGDAVLVAAADAFRAVLSECRRGDRVLAARYGGEELAVLLADFGRAGGERVAQRLRAAVGRIGAESGGALPDVTVSIGGAVLSPTATSPGELVADADAALYRAKHAGRDRVEWADGLTEELTRAPVGVGGVGLPGTAAPPPLATA